MDNKMFCYQCEQTAGCAGCTGAIGVCGKTADVAQLMQLNGIGQSRAEAIVAYREQCGRFTQIEDIQMVTGIKAGLYEKIKDKITVG